MMRVTAIALVLLFHPPLLCAREGKAKSPDEKAIDALIAGWIAAHDKGDANALSMFYAPDADFVGIDGQMVKGRDSIRIMYANVFAQLAGNKAVISLTSRRFVSPDTVVDDGTWRVTGVLPKGAPSKGRYTTVFTKRNGNWKILCARSMVPATLTAVKQ